MTINNIYSDPDKGPNSIHVVHVSDEERLTGKPNMSSVREGVIALNRDGVVVLENAIDLEHVDKLREAMLKDVDELVSRQATHYNFEDKDMGNMSQVPPFYPGYIFKDIMANPIGVAIMSSVIGPHFEFRWMHGNTALKATKRQRTHADFSWDYYDFPTGIVINIMLQDVTPENGATEFWLGTHKTSSLKKHAKPPLKGIDPEELGKRRAVRPPIYPCMKKGSYIIRDMRLWHAGMPNQTDVPRFMLGFLMFPAWYENSMLLKLPLSAKTEIDKLGDDVYIAPNYVEDSEYDHLDVPFDLECAPIGQKSYRY